MAKDIDDLKEALGALPPPPSSVVARTRLLPMGHQQPKVEPKEDDIDDIMTILGGEAALGDDLAKKNATPGTYTTPREKSAPRCSQP